MHSTPSASTAPPAFGYEPPRRDHEREKANVEVARRFLAAIEADTRGGSCVGQAVADFYAPDAVQVELPNRFLPDGARRTLAEIMAAGERGKKVLRSQRYEVKRAFAVGDSVILEVLWVGVLAVQVGSVHAGGEMRAHFAMFIEFERGRIKHQRNYDCFEPF
jgi:ketosteroid isomerase-like protein